MIKLLYFTGKQCGVCQALKPKLRKMIETDFSQYVSLVDIDVEEEQLLAAQHIVFTLPVLIIQFDDKEVKRFAGAFGLHQVRNYLESLISQVV